MATFLDALATLVTDSGARRGYRLDPSGWLRSHGAGHICGEDVAASLGVLRQWCPDQAPALPARPLEPVATRRDEADLDAAVRQVDHLVGALDDTEPA